MMRRVAIVLLAAAPLGCTDEHPPMRDCMARVWVHPEQSDVRVIGSYDDWARPGITPEPHESGWKLARFELPPGEHGYLLDTGSETVRDPHQPLSTFDTDDLEREVSLMIVPDCGQPRLNVERPHHHDGGMTIDAQFLASRDAAPLASVVATTDGGRVLSVDVMNPQTGDIVIATDLVGAREEITLVAEDEAGGQATARIVAWDQPRDARDEVIYQVMIDRFRGNEGAALAPPPHAGARAGGTLDGVRATLPEITSLGATALWLSPVYQGPDDTRAGNDGREYEGYHGYWPIDTRRVDDRIGGDAALDDLLAEAHDARLLVMADVVPNHVYETHPRFAEQGSADWFHPGGCVCGTASCPWNEHIEDCWFTPYLPDMRLEHPDALEAAVADVTWLLDRFPLDGLRVDAVPMMPRSATRRLAHEVRQRVQPAPLLLGEIFTGPGAGGLGQLKRHLGAAGMDSVFDFPLMWAMHDAIATGRGGFDAIEELLRLEESELDGSGAVLARILDNHDTPRFVSVANGEGFGDPWSAPAHQPEHAEPYERLQLGLALIFTLPGMPVLFQGDEIGLAGNNDPDCRRVMPTDEELNEHQRGVRATVAALGRLRRESRALRRGTRTVIEAKRETYVFERAVDDERVIVAMSTSAETQSLEIPGLDGFADALTGEATTGPRLTLAPRSFRILVPLTSGQP